MSLFTKRYHPPGTAPGTLVSDPRALAGRFQIRLIDFDPAQITIREDIEAEDCVSHLRSDAPTWIHVAGRVGPEALHELGRTFGLHHLAVEDVLNSGQRPKMERFDDQIFVIAALASLTAERVAVSQVSLFVGENFLVSLCDAEDEGFEPIVTRMRDPKSRVRNGGIDYLLYALLDLVVDHGFPLLEEFGAQLEELEERILSAVPHETLDDVHRIKRELIQLRRVLWPQREVINQLLRDEGGLIQPGTRVYLRDCYDHTIQIMDFLETYRDMTASLLDIYLSSVSNRMNMTMRVLTVIATIFIPLTFIVGIYGMNFDPGAGPWSMPELGWRYGYLSVWAVMLALAGGMVAFFRRHHWI